MTSANLFDILPDMITLVDYTVQVVAHVDLDTGEVVKVVPLYETISRGAPTEVKDYGTDENGDKISPKLVQDGYKIADNSEWPAWD